MTTLPGVKFVKNAKGEITHVTISRKQNAKLVEDMIDAAEIKKARKDTSVSWDEAKERLLKKKA